MSTVVNQAPPTPREMVTIAVGLTVVCLIAGIILGGVFFITEPAKVQNQVAREQSSIRSLLSLSETAQIQEVRRYIYWRGKDLEVIYLTPTGLVTLDAAGKEKTKNAVPIEIAELPDNTAKDLWVKNQIAPADTSEAFKYVGRFFIGIENEAPVGYVVEGRSAGYKTWIRFFLAINSEFNLQGLEVVHHEEDPGLGDEITKRYFKNQFAGKSAAQIEKMEITKDPLPSEWKSIVEELGDIDFFDWYKKHQDEVNKHPDIHAITGATISSVAVLDGVKRSLKNFEKRMKMVGDYL